MYVEMAFRKHLGIPANEEINLFDCVDHTGYHSWHNTVTTITNLKAFG